MAAKWVLLGTRDVQFTYDKDFVPVTFLGGSFSHLQLRVKGNSIRMIALRVRFSNQELVTLPIRATIPAGGKSRAIRLPGGRRYISYIALEYRSVLSSRGPATVQVWGQR